jgi:orotidine-5'-phosphate decarboxylase
VNECRAIKLACGEEFLVVTPGIRLAGEGAQDQARVATPEVATAAGADYLVVGRTITRADDPLGALEMVRTALNS